MSKSIRLLTAALLLTGGLTACTNPTTPSPTGTAAISAGTTLATIAASNNATVAGLVTRGQLFCQTERGIVALVTLTASPTSVIGQTAAVVGNACAAISAVPVPAPASPAQVPVVAAPAAGAIAATP